MCPCCGHTVGESVTKHVTTKDSPFSLFTCNDKNLAPEYLIRLILFILKIGVKEVEVIGHLLSARTIGLDSI